MKVAVVGPLVKDIITIDNHSQTLMGGIPYYEGRTLKSFGVEVVAYVTYAKSEEQFVQENFQGIKIVPLYVKNTLTHELIYKSKNPDTRAIKVPLYDPNIFSVDKKILQELKGFDYILLGPLYYENIPYEFFETMKDHHLVINNFGLFGYHENGVPVSKNPENFTRIAPFLECVSLDEKEMKFASQKDTGEEGAKLFLNLGVKQVLMTCASKGSFIFTKNKKYTIPAFPPKKLVDPTGAGDTYLAAFIYSQELFGEDMQKRGEFAAMSATMAIERGGAFTGNTQEVLNRLKGATSIS
jgi:sugar/nucleoside kinase (ribokinase family)